MKRKNGLVKVSLACALIFGSVGLLAGCGKDDAPQVTVSSVEVQSSGGNKFELDSNITLEGIGADIKVKMSDGTEQTIQIKNDMWKKEDYDFSTLGEKTITLKFKVGNEEKTATIKINIIEPQSVIDVMAFIETNFSSEPSDEWVDQLLSEAITSYNALNEDYKPLVSNFDLLLNAYKERKTYLIKNCVDRDNYLQNEINQIESIQTQAGEDIFSAVDIEEVNLHYTTALNDINNVNTSIVATKLLAKAVVDNYFETQFYSNDYYAEEWNLLQARVLQIKESIDEYTNIESMNYFFESEYSDFDMMLVDTKVAIDFQNAVNDTTPYEEITADDLEELALLNVTYELLSNEDKVRVSEYHTILSDNIAKARPLYIEKKKSDLDQLLVGVEDRYTASDAEIIENMIEGLKDDLDAYNYFDYADIKLAIDDYYTQEMNFINQIEPCLVKEIKEIFVTLPKTWWLVDWSEAYIWNETDVYQTYGNKFYIGDEEYELSLADNRVYLAENYLTYYNILDGEVEINGITYNVTSYANSKLNDLRTKYNKLSAEDKEQYLTADEREFIINYNSIVFLKLDHKARTIMSFKAALNQDDYTNENWEIIKGYLEEMAFYEISAYTVDDFKSQWDTFITPYGELVWGVLNRLQEKKATVSTELSAYYNSEEYYENELTEIEVIINQAITNANDVTKGSDIDAAIGEVQAIIDAAKLEIDAVKTSAEIDAENQ